MSCSKIRTIDVLAFAMLAMLSGCTALENSITVGALPNEFWFGVGSLDEVALSDLRSKPGGEKIHGWRIVGLISGGSGNLMYPPSTVFVGRESDSSERAFDNQYFATGNLLRGEDGVEWVLYELHEKSE